jgi:hypothetical protein
MESFSTIIIASLLWGIAISLFLISLCLIITPFTDHNCLKEISAKADVDKVIEQIVMKYYYDDPILVENRTLFKDTMEELNESLDKFLEKGQ